MKDAINRVSIPSIVLELLWTDDEFFREVSANKKVSNFGKFPRCDQWCDADGFHMAFALAGYSPRDLILETNGNEIFISGFGVKLEIDDSTRDDATLSSSTGKAESGADASLRGSLTASDNDEEYPSRLPSLTVQKGMIVRGIARRNFKSNYFINSSFDVSRLDASMSNGLLEVTIPRRAKEVSKLISIKEL